MIKVINDINEAHVGDKFLVYWRDTFDVGTIDYVDDERIEYTEDGSTTWGAHIKGKDREDNILIVRVEE